MVGDTKTSMVRVDHMGWLRCDGRSLLRSEYRTLFAVLGTDFGSVDADHFNLPDAEGRVVAMIGQADSISNTWVDGDMSGEERHTLTIAELPPHNHDISGGNLNTANGVDPSGNGITSRDVTGIASSGQYGLVENGENGGTLTGGATDSSLTEPKVLGDAWRSVASQDPGHRHTIASNGGGQPHNNIQPTIYMGNLFIYCGRALHNITDAGGIALPATNRSYYPPSIPANRLY